MARNYQFSSFSRIVPVLVIISVLLCQTCKCQDEVLKYNVTEEIRSGTFVGDIRGDSKLRSTASEDEFSQITYSILSQGHDYEKYFTVDRNNGTLFTSGELDRETLTSCVFEVTCVLQLSIVARAKVSSFYRTLKVEVTVRDINDNAPVFRKEVTLLDISELATVGSSMSLVGAVDADSGQFSLQRYFILYEDTLNLPFTTSYERFVDGSSVVKLEITGDLDRETRDTYSLIIVAEDGGDPALTGTMTVSIFIEDTNDNAPVFTQTTYNVTVNETIPVYTEILTLSASDADLDENGRIQYSLSKNQIGKIHEQFALNETTGALIVKEKFVSGGEYRIIVEASDSGTQPLMTQAVVKVTVLDSDNNRPVMSINLFSDTNIGSVSEYADIGTVVAHIRIIDTDTGVNGIIECEINSDDDVFKLQGYDVNEYKVTVAKEIDRETVDYIYVVVNCNDRGSPPKNTFAEFTVQVIDENDHAPEFLSTIYQVDVVENNAINKDIIQVAASDKDAGNNSQVTYSVWAPVAYRFSMDPMSGIIKAMSVFDRETDDRILLYAYAKDNGSPPRTSTATIIITILDENDNSPNFTEPFYVFYVQENTPSGTFVGKVIVNDSDDGHNGRVGLVIDPVLPFTIDASGEIRTKKALDREEIESYGFLVTAYDHGIPTRNTSSNVIIHVTDVNDHVPKFTFPDTDNFTVELDAESHTDAHVAQIKAIDDDDSNNGQLYYSILNVNVTELFSLDSVSGNLTLRRPIQETDPTMYNILLRVEDHGTPELYATTALNVFIARRQNPAAISGNKGENLVIAITLGVVTLVLVFTIVLVIFILRRKWFHNGKDNSDSDDEFYQKVKVTDRRRVKFSDEEGNETHEVTPARNEPMTTFGSDGNDSSRDSDMTSSSADMERPILERQKLASKEKAVVSLHKENLPGISETQEMHHSSPRSATNPPRYDSLQPRSDINKPRSDATKARSDSLPRYENLQQLHALQSHNNLLNSTIKPQMSYSGVSHDDNHSQTSGETVTSDSGRGGSESDIHSASLSQSHDSDTRTTFSHEPAHSTLIDPTKPAPHKPWLNLADLRYHNCKQLPVAQQLHDDRKHRLQIRNLAERNSARPSAVNTRRPHTGFQTQSDRNLQKFRMPPTSPLQQMTFFPPPPSDIDRSFMTYEDEEDDLSTTTSGSYTIDQEDISLDFRSPLPKTPGLKSCLV